MRQVFWSVQNRICVPGPPGEFRVFTDTLLPHTLIIWNLKLAICFLVFQFERVVKTVWFCWLFSARVMTFFSHLFAPSLPILSAQGTPLLLFTHKMCDIYLITRWCFRTLCRTYKDEYSFSLYVVVFLSLDPSPFAPLTPSMFTLLFYILNVQLSGVVSYSMLPLMLGQFFVDFFHSFFLSSFFCLIRQVK